MGKRTVLPLTTSTLTTGTLSIFCISTAAAASLGANVRITRLELGQKGTTTLQMLDGEIATRDNGGTLTMTSKAPVCIEPVGGAASGLSGNTAPVGGAGRSGVNASVDSGGAFTQLVPFAFANLAGLVWKPDPKEELWIPASTFVVVRLLTAPTTLTGWLGALYLEEM